MRSVKSMSAVLALVLVIGAATNAAEPMRVFAKPAKDGSLLVEYTVTRSVPEERVRTVTLLDGTTKEQRFTVMSQVIEPRHMGIKNFEATTMSGMKLTPERFLKQADGKEVPVLLLGGDCKLSDRDRLFFRKDLIVIRPLPDKK